ncbi:MAG: nicotinate-nucleotide adenylyltransferase [Chloroflexota bacterium]|nr:nicotinate-nucleotide adenylyltransferase [Chloroflexota bacterium]
MKLGVFGGTFDPIHHGHLVIALAAVEQLSLDRVVFVPAKRSPLKSDAPVAGEADRLAMLERAIAGEPRFECSRAELEGNAPSYTVDTLEALSAKGTLFLILGGDAVRDLDRWKDPERIRRLATIVVARRPGSEATTGEFVLLDTPLMDVSSRDLRARAARGRSLRYLVPDSVWRYIKDRDLYKVTASTAS